MKNTNWIAVAGVMGALAVIIEAFGAHALPEHLKNRGFHEPQIAQRLATFETGARHHMYAALALLALGVSRQGKPKQRWGTACGLLLYGAVIFSGNLYAIALLSNDYKKLGMIVPLGGLLMIAGWAVIAVTASGGHTALGERDQSSSRDTSRAG